MTEELSGPTPSTSGDTRQRWEAERTTFQRVYDVVTGLTGFSTAGEVAERAACSDDGARDALSQLVEMGIAEKRDGRPAEYRRNESYFRWRRVEELASEHAPSELRARVEDLLAEDEVFQDRFDAPDPDAVSPEVFETGDHDAIHDRWEDVSRWRTVRNYLAVLQRAAHRAERRERDDADDAAPV